MALMRIITPWVTTLAAQLNSWFTNAWEPPPETLIHLACTGKQRWRVWEPSQVILTQSWIGGPVPNASFSFQSEDISYDETVWNLISSQNQNTEVAISSGIFLPMAPLLTYKVLSFPLSPLFFVCQYQELQGRCEGGEWPSVGGLKAFCSPLWDRDNNYCRLQRFGKKTESWLLWQESMSRRKLVKNYFK